MKWIDIIEGEHKTLPPEGNEVFFDGGENPPVFGRIKYNGIMPSLILLDSSGEEEWEDVWKYERWLDENIDAEGGKDGYWQRRCEAAEYLLSRVDNNINKQFVGYKEWEALKLNNPL